MMTLAASIESSGLNPMAFQDQHGTVLLERLRYQRETGRFCDVVIRVHERQFAAHRNVLAACSPYFDAILQVNMITKEQVTVNCPNAVAFELLLNYMYSGSVVIDRSSVSDLLRLANNFLITKVKNYCAEYLDRHLDAANCLAVRQLAAKYNLPILLKTAIEFFDVNINRCLLESVDILQYSVHGLQKILDDPKYANSISADVHVKLAARWASDDIQNRTADFRYLLSLCRISQVSQGALEFVLDYSPLLNKDQKSRMFLLHVMAGAGLNMSKYEKQYSQLIGQFGPDADFLNIDLQEQYEDENENDYGEPLSHCGSEDLMVDGHPSASHVLHEATPYVAQSTDGFGGFKLKIALPGKAKIEDKPHKRKGFKQVRKNRRVEGDEGPSTSNEPQFDEDEVDGVYTLDDAILFPEADQFNPEGVDEEEEENEPGGQFLCSFCRFATNENDDFHRHLARRHNRNTIFTCLFCPFECCWSAQLYEHVQQGHFKDAPPYMCMHCQYSTDAIHDLLSHELIHLPDRPFKCASCGWQGRTRGQLWAHERVHGTEQLLPCNECGRTFRKEESLRSHLASHHEHRPHVCPDCGWASRSESDLLAHRSLSHQVDVYNCHITGCDYVSTKKSQLAAHLRTHLAVRAHTCKICGRGFIEKSHLVRHERIHLEDKPFKCESCEYASSRRDKLKEHILKHHNGTPANKIQRRRYKRAKQLAAAIAMQNKPMPNIDVMFRPIQEQQTRNDWNAHHPTHFSPNHRSTSVIHSVPSHVPQSPGSMSLLNVHLTGPDTPLMKDVVLGEASRMENNLVTPVPRSPHNHSDPFGMANNDGVRPMSLPPYGQNSWY